ncbi:MAG: tRNA pseudouridine(55) synthase TruB [Spirochaetaceae bacterium]|nr:MAG: tRNA pseudouridine(55) synthase TruB [Spirochaetaceae bacterium]
MRHISANTNACILLDKPPGITSFRALKQIKDRMGTSKVGHAGTLDSFAQGLLVICTGKYTRLAGMFMALPKEYLATFVFGTTTDTLDPVGQTTGSGRIPEEKEIREVIGSFTGEISQRPPEYSSVHINGKRAWKYAREGQAVIPQARPVVISGLVMESYNPPEAVFRVSCSKGTYIRSLARDIAQALGTVAFVKELHRTKIGRFSVQDAVAPDAFDPAKHCMAADVIFQSIPGVNLVKACDELCRLCVYGKDISRSGYAQAFVEGLNAVLDEKNRLVALVQKTENGFSYKMVTGEA